MQLTIFKVAKTGINADNVITSILQETKKHDLLCSSVAIILILKYIQECRQFKREEILVFLRKCENWGVNFRGF